MTYLVERLRAENADPWRAMGTATILGQVQLLSKPNTQVKP